MAGGGDDDHTVYCYDPSQDKWTSLPLLPVKYFGLGQVNGKLVAVGGTIKSDDKGMKPGYNEISNEVYRYDERSQQWKLTTPSMPTARHSPGVLSLQSALVVAGGYTLSDKFANAVEIFKPDTSQWCRTDPLPIDCCDVSLAAIGNTCYMLGGYKAPQNLNQAFHASADDLLCNAVPSNQITHGDNQSAWKTLPKTPAYRPAAAVLGGSLIAVGGYSTEISREGVDKKEIYKYSPSTNSWIYISDLPVSRSDISVNALSSTEIVVIGGKFDGDRVKNVYKGTLHLLQ